MDKQFKLTDRVSKDSIKSPIFKKWVKRILCIACILSLALQLTLCCLPFQVSAAENDSFIGTWVFNETLTKPNNFPTSTNHILQLPCNFIGVDSSGSELECNYFGFQFWSNTDQRLVFYITGGNYTTAYNFYNNTWNSDSKRTIVITEEINDVASRTWLKANASKVVEEVYDFTGETRIFNDELTLFNTSEATFTYSFNFNFEVLGVGTADYLILQRTTQNNYTMSYSFDFEDSGGLSMIYRDSPPFDNGEAEWLGGKVNRKVITFITNPEDPEFQQWLLDNTTLFDNVKDAYQLGQQSGYNNGYEEGFGNSLIGDSLSGPINALSQITLIEIQGTAITLGGVVMTSIALCLVLAFLKLYAGG